MSSGKKRSPLWKYFDIYEDDSRYAECLLCKLKISRGGEGKKAGTSAMKNHMKSKHADKFAEIGLSISAETSIPSTSKTTSVLSQTKEQKQLTLTETIERKLIWDINDAKSKEYHYLIAEMIALDNEPLSMVERVGFKRLMEKALPRYRIPSRTYITDNIIPDIYERIHTKIEENISQTPAISVTSDMWTCTHNNASFLSFTAHWLSPEFRIDHAVLAMKPFSGSHTGENIAKELNAIATRWDIPQSKIHLLVHDSGANMVKGVKVARYGSARCFIHSLQLVVNDSLKSQPEVLEVIAAARRIVTHFNHSGLAQEKLKNIQKELILPEHQLVQDVSTRWNSTFYMLERLLKQKRAVSLYITDHNTVNNLTIQQWELMEQCIRLLKPFEEITKITSSSCSCISEVIPNVATLMRYLDKEDTAYRSNNLLNMIVSLKTELKRRFDFDDNKNYLLATLLDPRFKTSFMAKIQAEKARQMILLEAVKNDFNDSSSSEGDSSPPKKKKQLISSTEDNVTGDIHNTFWDCFKEVAEENSNANENVSGKTAAASELEYYLKTARIERTSDPHAWWFTNFKQYSILSKFAKIYLSAPCSSVYSERLFSEAGNVYENKRNRLLPLNAEKLVFIHHNLPLINFKY